MTQGDVEETAALLAATQEHGMLTLPDLAEAALFCLEPAGSALVEDQSWQSWHALPAARREQLSALALDDLVTRGLLDRASAGSAVAAPPLALVLQGRRQPNVVVCSVPGTPSRSEPRMYALAEQGHGVRFVLAERGGEHQVRHYGLATPTRAGRMLAAWTVEGSGRRGLLRRTPTRTIALYRHDEGAPLVRDTVQVQQGEPLLVRREARDGSAPTQAMMDAEQLGLLLTDLLLGRQ